jgi:acyl dehydratase
MPGKFFDEWQIGETIEHPLRRTVTELRESKSRPNAGLVTWKHRMHNQRDEVVCECLRTALLLRSAA